MAITASAAGGKWSETAAWTGGVVPTSGEDVILASTSGAITVSATAECRSIEASAYTKTLKVESGKVLRVGAATSNGGLCMHTTTSATVEVGGTLEMVATAGTVESITVPKIIGGGVLLFKGTGGQWVLQENLTSSGSVEVLVGELNTNGKTLSLKSGFSASGTSTVTLGASTLLLGGTNSTTFVSTITLNAGTSTIEVTDTTTTKKTFAGGGHTFATVTISGNYVEITGANTFGTLNVNTARASTACKASLTAVSNHMVVTEGEANIAVGVEVEGVAIPKGTTILKKVEAGVWEMSANATETVAVPEAVTVYAAGLLFVKSVTQTVTGTFATNGKAGELARLATSESGKAATISKTSGTVSVNFMRLKDSHAIGGASWYAGTSSVSVSGDEGWKFEAPSEAFSGTATIRAAGGVAASGSKTASGSPTLRAGAPTSAVGIKQGTGTSVALAAIRDTATGAKRASGAAAAGAGIDLGATGRKTVSGTTTARVGASGTAVGVKAGSGSVAQPMGVRQTGLGAKQGTGSSVALVGAVSKTLGVKVAGGTSTVRAGTVMIASGVRSSVGLALLRVADNLLTESEGKHSGTAMVPAGERLFVSAGKAVQGSSGMRAGVRSVVVGLKGGLGAGVGHVGARLLTGGTAAREGHASIGTGSHSSSLVTKATHGEAQVRVSAATSAIEGKVSLGSALLRFAIRLATFQRPQPTTILVVTRASTSLAVASRSPTTIGVLSRSHTTIEEETF